MKIAMRRKLHRKIKMADDEPSDISPPSPTTCALFFLLLLFVKIASDIDNGIVGSSSNND